MVSNSPYHLWVGLSDHGKEGVFRMMNGTKYDPSDKSVSALYYWEGSEPNNGRTANCVQYWHINNGFADSFCHYEEYEDRYFHGLCEIKSYNCLEED